VPLKGQKIGFLGAGVMAEALISGLLKAGLVSPAGLIACDVNTGRLELLKGKYLIETTVANQELIKQADMGAASENIFPIS
jgi:pyrroline-5-carboxylate reductase